MVTVNEIEVTQFDVTVDPTSEIITVNIGIGSAAGGAYTSASFAADFQAQDTDNLSEGITNLYFTDERVDDRVSNLLVGGSNTTLTYNDFANTLTIDVASPPQLTTQDEGINAGTNVDTINFVGPGVSIADVGGTTTVTVPGTPVGTTDDLPEGLTNLYYTDGRVTTLIGTTVNKAFVDLLNVDADTLDGLDSTAFATAAQGTLAGTSLQPADIGVTVQSYNLILDGTTASFTVAEESKLAGIEANATADQTAAEIKTAYESNLNTNAYTDAEVTKLAGIEANATADLNAGEIKTLYESNVNTNAYTDTDSAKLAGIEALADVTDATNVNAAGAVMNTDTTTAEMSFVIDEDTMVSNLATKVPTQQSVKNYVDNAVVGNLTYRGAYNASANIPDLDTAPSGILTGDMYTVTTAGTFFTTLVEPGDALIAEANNPVGEADWTIVQANLTAASIKTQYESNSNTNAYTDAEVSKLAGIEANATADQTPAELLTALLTVDGIGSLLDADLLDGQQGAHYLDYTNFTNTPTLYTSANFDTDFGLKSTTNLSEGTNLYFTDERVDDRVAALLVGGTNISITYNDVANTLTVDGATSLTTQDDGVLSGTDIDTLNFAGNGVSATTVGNTTTVTVSGAGLASTDDLSEGITNLYYTEGRVNANFATKTTTDLTEGTNLYYTDARANTAIDTRVTASYVNALDLTIDGGTF